jgi:homoserine dehydrogenase
MKPLKIGLAGLGTVGGGVLKLLRDHQGLIARRAGRKIEIVAVSARHRRKKRAASLGRASWLADPMMLARRADVDVVVELIGGADGVALKLCQAALEAGKHVVTANKAMLAHHGVALGRLGERSGAQLRFEAAVAGGVPIVKALREGLAANRITRIYGILNGTCNYILTTMRSSGASFQECLNEAKRLGFAEADPSLDIDGVDAAHKLAILTSLAFGCPVDFGGIQIEGIRHVSALDVAFADEFGYRIKLLAVAQAGAQGLEQRVQPCLVTLQSPIAHVDGVMNAVVAEGDSTGATMFEGRGAGAGPTASAVAADLIDLARGQAVPTFGVPISALKALKRAKLGQHTGRYYIRLNVLDRPGVIAAISAVLRDQKISIESLVQRGRAEAHQPVPVVLITHETSAADLSRALTRIARLKPVIGAPRKMRIERL